MLHFKHDFPETSEGIDTVVLEDETQKNVDFNREGGIKDEQLGLAVIMLLGEKMFILEKVMEKLSKTTDEAIFLIVLDNDEQKNSANGNINSLLEDLESDFRIEIVPEEDIHLSGKKSIRFHYGKLPEVYDSKEKGLAKQTNCIAKEILEL